MNKKYGILSVLIVASLLITGSGLAFAYGPEWKQNPNSEVKDEDGVPNRLDEDYERPMDGSNSPWVVGDERLDRFQTRFELTDSEMDQLQDKVDELLEGDVNHEEIQNAIKAELENFGIENPELLGPRNPQSKGRRGQGKGMNLGNCPYQE